MSTNVLAIETVQNVKGSAHAETFAVFGYERLADSTHREGLRPYVRQPRWATGNSSIENTAANWARYQARMTEDVPVESTLRLLRMAASSGVTTILIVANFDTDYEKQVRDWLYAQVGPEMLNRDRVVILTRTYTLQSSNAAKYSASTNAMSLLPKIAGTGAECVLAVTANGQLSKVLRTHFPTTVIVRGGRARFKGTRDDESGSDRDE